MIMKTKHVKNTWDKWSGGGKLPNYPRGANGPNSQGGQKLHRGGLAPFSLNL